MREDDEIERLRAELAAAWKEAEEQNESRCELLKTIGSLRADLAAERERREYAVEDLSIAYMQGRADAEAFSKATVAKLRAALEPFATWADTVKGALFFDGLPDDHIMTTTGDGKCEKWIYMRDLRRARAVLAETGGGDE